MKESINKTFNQFKIHTQYSICEGAVKIDQLKISAKKIKSNHWVYQILIIYQEH